MTSSCPYYKKTPQRCQKHRCSWHRPISAPPWCTWMHCQQFSALGLSSGTQRASDHWWRSTGPWISAQCSSRHDWQVTDGCGVASLGWSQWTSHIPLGVHGWFSPRMHHTCSVEARRGCPQRKGSWSRPWTGFYWRSSCCRALLSSAPTSDHSQSARCRKRWLVPLAFPNTSSLH